MMDYVTAAYEISLWNTKAAETDVQPNLRALQNLTLPADVMKIYCIEVVLTWLSERSTVICNMEINYQMKHTQVRPDYGFNYTQVMLEFHIHKNGIRIRVQL